MPVFVQIVSSLVRAHVDDEKDSRRLSEVMKKLQDKGAKILDVKLTFGVNLVYLITYEAQTPLEIEE